MQVTLAQAGIVAGILTLSWVVGRPKEILSAPPTGNHPHQVFNTTSKAHAEKVASLVPDSIVKGDSGHPLNWFVMSKTPYAEARSYYAPWLRENDYFRSNQFLSEVKYEAESFNADDDYTDEQLLKVARWDIENQIDRGAMYAIDEEPKAEHCDEDGNWEDGENFYTIVNLYAQYQEDEERAEKILWEMFKKEYPQYLGDGMAAESFSANPQGRPYCEPCAERGFNYYGAKTCGDCGYIQCKRCFGDGEICKSCEYVECENCGDMESPDWIFTTPHGEFCVDCRSAWIEDPDAHKALYSAEDTTTCEDCGVKIGYDEAIDWEGLDRCEDCYDYWMMKDRQNYTGDETDCISCGYSISPNDVRFELVEGLCPDCKADGSFQAEEFDRSNIRVWKDWKPKKYPYEMRVTSETKSKWCENCGELDDSDEDAWNHYQFVLKQKNSTKPVMRFISGGACEGCGMDLCQNCIEGATSGNFNPLFEPICEDCGYPFCKECKDEDRCDNCEQEYESNRCDCCGHVHHAESKKLNPIEKPIISGAASGATIEGLEDLMMSEPYDSEDCPLCLEKIDFGDAYEEPDNYHLCDSCDEAVQEKRYDHAYSAEAVTDSELAELRTKLSKQRTAMSAMRTALAAMGLYLAYDTYKDHKKIK